MTTTDTPTLIEWIRYCKRSGLYEQGKLLYEKGGLNLNSLSEEVMVNVEEDYQLYHGLFLLDHARASSD